MRVVVFSSAPIVLIKNHTYLYSPYEKEMRMWAKYANVQFCCPVWKEDRNLLVSKINFSIEPTVVLDEFAIKSSIAVFLSIPKVLKNLILIFQAMQNADHIHLRCPGNIGLLGCLVQIFFPSKPKTAKYAGNWDPNSMQPWSYRLQKWILSNTFLTRNMQVLVYGEWENQSTNIKSFFTATYGEKEKAPLKPLSLKDQIRFVFVGSLVKGKNPLYAIQLVQRLLEKGQDIVLDIYGEGTLRQSFEAYILLNNLSSRVFLHGNKEVEIIKFAYQNSHFVILPSKSEGWPKAIAEGMFWGCVPLATAVSCVPYMLNFGKRGLLLRLDLRQDQKSIEKIVEDFSDFESKRIAAVDWSRQYTLNRFEEEIKLLLR